MLRKAISAFDDVRSTKESEEKNMTETEWLKHGYDMGIVEPDNIATETFGQIYVAFP
mgnify:FL=1